VECGDGVPFSPARLPPHKTNDFSLEMACFDEFSSGILVRALARNMLNFTPEVVI